MGATTSIEVRVKLVEALRLDLVGPWVGHEFANERLEVRPSTWYLTGFLIPSGTPTEQRGDIDSDEELDVVPASSGPSEESTEERKAAKKGYFPSSMGLSFLVGPETKYLTVVARWGDYKPADVGGEDRKSASIWQRTPREELVEIQLDGVDKPPVRIPRSQGLEVQVVTRTIDATDLDEHLPNHTRSVSVFLVNRRAPVKGLADSAYAFQAELEVRSETPLIPRPNLQGMQAGDWDERVADLHYADRPEYATGHAVSAHWEMTDGACRVLRTTWIPSAEVEKTATAAVKGVELSMDRLGALDDGAAVQAALMPLVTEYRAWIQARQDEIPPLSEARRATAEQLLQYAKIAANRIERGILLLAKDPDALDSFRVANRSVARALRKRLKVDAPGWRAFQLAFMLLNLPGIIDPTDPNRNTVDLLFFPTGGGKTEAYLGLAAFTMVLRRLRNPADKGLTGAGVSVMMRYTLRLLTLDQLGRAAGLVCALELERAQAPQRYGDWPFEIGLWVGKKATPNVLGYKGEKRSDSARAKVRQYKNDPHGKPSPIPLENCPWCGEPIKPQSFSLLPNDDRPRQLRVVCANIQCDFTRNRPLPIVAVDESIYRRLPAFLIATVDKFASLPWVGEAGALLGGANRYDQDGFYGASEPNHGHRLSSPLPPPDLIIQDELHLISGPLGTMAGLYETAIEALCIQRIGDHQVRPKIVASTATVRQAQDQIQALFGRSQTMIFPPQGPERQDSFFAHTVPTSQTSGRLYLGVAAQGRNPKVIMRKVWLALMGAAERSYRDAGGKKNEQNPADPYMTVLGYFNSLRELGGARRILEEEVQNTIKSYGGRKRIDEEPGLFRGRTNLAEVMELTSRVPTDKAALARRRLEAPFHDPQHVDSAIATNMISVGLDIPRLGLMVVLGQPKTHAEYIQATSRVGRDDKRPGLVVTVLNVHKPRDRSHYERFRNYHETFYRSVEVSSVTPFSARALDRGFAGALVSLARHGEARMTPARGAELIAAGRATLEGRLQDFFLERVRQQPIADEGERDECLRSVQNRIVDLLDSWHKVFKGYHDVGVPFQYQKYEQDGAKPLLREMLDKDFESSHHRKFRANRSLRDVEPEVNLFLKTLDGRDVKEENE